MAYGERTGFEWTKEARLVLDAVESRKRVCIARDGVSPPAE